MASIGYMDYYLPSNTICVHEFFEKCKDELFPDPQNAAEVEKYFIEKAGFDKIAIEKERNILGIFEELVQKYLDETNIDKNSIKYIFYTDIATSLTDGGITSVPNYIKEKFNIENASVSEINQQCGSCVWTIGMASRLLRENEVAIILTANMMEGFTERYKPHSIIGDAAAIMEIKYSNDGIEILDFDFNTKQYEGEVGINNNLEMMKVCSRTINNLLNRNGVSKDELACVLHQNLSIEIYEIIFCLLLELNKDVLFWDNIKEIAHIGDADLIANCRDVMKKRKMKKGDKMVFYAIGEISKSVNYNCILLQVNN